MGSLYVASWATKKNEHPTKVKQDYSPSMNSVHTDCWGIHPVVKVQGSQKKGLNRKRHILGAGGARPWKLSET